MSKILIAHRGNLDGPNPEKENHPDYIMAAVSAGYNVEIDVWYTDGKLVLGHDKPQYEIPKSFWMPHEFWIHAKNIDALVEISKWKGAYLFNYFYHQTDDCVLTSRGFIWTYPDKPIISEHQIAVMPEIVGQDYNYSKAGGVCTDFVNLLKLKI